MQNLFAEAITSNLTELPNPGVPTIIVYGNFYPTTKKLIYKRDP